MHVLGRRYTLSPVDIGAPEIITLVVIAIVMFGPERIPELARKAAKVLHFLRGIANGATSQLKAELGPEYAHLTAADLNPKTFIQKHLLDEFKEEIDDIKKDVESIKGELADEASTLSTAAADVNAAVQGDIPAEELVTVVPFDSEAT